MEGNYDLAQEYTKVLFTQENVSASKELSQSEIPVGGRVTSSASYQILNGLRYLGTRLGLNLPELDRVYSESKLPTSAVLFIALLEEVVDFDEPETVSASVEALYGWLDDPDMDAASLIEALAAIAFIHSQREEMDRAQEVASRIQAWLLAKPREELDESALQTFILILPHIDFSVDIEMARVLFESNMLRDSQVVDLLRTLRNGVEGSELLAVVRIADADDVGLSVLRELRSIVAETTEEDYLRKLDARILTLENAFESIEFAGEIRETVESS